MTDYATAIRKAYYTALAGEITYLTDEIPVVDEKIEGQIDMNNVYYIRIADLTINQSDNKNKWVTTADLTIEIVNRKYSAVKKMDVEAIGSLILNRLFPTRTTHNLTIDAPFNITFARMDRSDMSVQQIEANVFQQVKSFVFRNRITQ